MFRYCSNFGGRDVGFFDDDNVSDFFTIGEPWRFQV